MISETVKKLIIEADRKGKFHKDIAQSFGVNVNTVRTIIHRFKKFGAIQRPHGHRPKKLPQSVVDELRSWYDEDCTLTLDGAKDKIMEKFGIEVCNATVYNYLKGINFSIKKITVVPERRNCPDVIAARKLYAVEFLRVDQDREKVIFVDETGIQVHARLSRGWAEKGTRARLTVKAVRGKNYSICAAIAYRSLFFYEAKEKGYNTDTFVEFIGQLITHLNNENISGATIIMDNVRFHHAQDVRAIIDNAGHNLLFLPAYSPFLNPIEEMFNQLKHYVKLYKPKTPEEVFTGVELASQVISEDNCKNYYSHMLSYLPKCLNEEIILN